MKRLRTAIWLGLILVLTTGAFVSLYVPSMREVAEARADYNLTRERLESVNNQTRSLEGRLDDLQTRVDSVVLDARREYRLVKPGERLELIHVVDGPAR